MKKLLDVCSLFMAVIGSCTAILVCYILFIYPNISNNDSSDNKDNIISSQSAMLTSESVSTDSNQNENLPQFDDVVTETTPSETESNTNSIPSGTYNIDDIEFWFSDSVMNDVTGRWRISSIASSKDITEYVADYYNILFSSDDEVHAIVNFSLNTTTSVSVLPDGRLDVVIHDYIDGEEHDAKALFGGMLLKEYFINPQTGEFEEISAYSPTPPIEQSEPNVIYSYEVPIENSNQAANNFISTGNGDNFNTYNNPAQQQTSASYVLNSNPERMKIHIPTCSDVKKIAPENYLESNLSISELETQGYSKCRHCLQ